MLQNSKLWKIVGIGGLSLFLLGCAQDGFMVQKETSSATILEEVVVLEDDRKSVGTESREEISGNSQKSENTQIDSVEAEMIAVHICGAVNNPGVYYFKEKQRIYEGILEAGGFREDAECDYLNQALFMEDGMKITVPTKEEIKRLEEANQIKTQEQFLQSSDRFSQEEFGQGKGKVDLNTADEALLCTLPGIGESRAKSIIAYRQEHGAFQKAEDIMKVPGIKEAAFEKIRDFVMVRD